MLAAGFKGSLALGVASLLSIDVLANFRWVRCQASVIISCLQRVSLQHLTWEILGFIAWYLRAAMLAAGFKGSLALGVASLLGIDVLASFRLVESSSVCNAAIASTFWQTSVGVESGFLLHVGCIQAAMLAAGFKGSLALGVASLLGIDVLSNFRWVWSVCVLSKDIPSWHIDAAMLAAGFKGSLALGVALLLGIDVLANFRLVESFGVCNAAIASTFWQTSGGAKSGFLLRVWHIGAAMLAAGFKGSLALGVASLLGINILVNFRLVWSLAPQYLQPVTH
jgi:hypothetical protein